MWKEIIISLLAAILTLAVLGYFDLAGILALILLSISLIISIKRKIIEERQIMLLREEGEKTILGVVAPRAPRALEPVPLRLKIRNPLNTKGLRVRFHSIDYINPSDLELTIDPGEETDVEVILVPFGSGKREFSITVAPLYDENGNLIPNEIADDISIQQFAYDAEENILGLSSKQRSLLSSLIRFALTFSAINILAFSYLSTLGLGSILEILSRVVPPLLILQVPVLMLLFYLDGKLPKKPKYVFE